MLRKTPMRYGAPCDFARPSPMPASWASKYLFSGLGQIRDRTLKGRFRNATCFNLWKWPRCARPGRRTYWGCVRISVLLRHWTPLSRPPALSRVLLPVTISFCIGFSWVPLPLLCEITSPPPRRSPLYLPLLPGSLAHRFLLNDSRLRDAQMAECFSRPLSQECILYGFAVA